MSAPTDQDRPEIEEQELGGQMSFLDHLEELRRRILHSLIAVGVAFGVCWYFADDLFRVFFRLITEHGGELIQDTITSPFTIQFKMALMASIFLAAPFLLAQIWLFVSPGLYKRERQYALPFIFFASILFVAGGVFGYFVALPFGIQYLVQMGKDLGMKSYLNVSDAFDLVLLWKSGWALFLKSRRSSSCSAASASSAVLSYFET